MPCQEQSDFQQLWVFNIIYLHTLFTNMPRDLCLSTVLIHINASNHFAIYENKSLYEKNLTLNNVGPNIDQGPWKTIENSAFVK